MKTSLTLSALLALPIALTSIACAKPQVKNPDVKVAIAGNKVDKNDDKQLSAEELNKLKENYEGKREKAQAKMLKKFDTNNDGQLDDSEKEARKAAIEARKQERRAKVLEKFDTDKDGKLSKEEKKAAREAAQGKKNKKGPRKPNISAGRIADTNKDATLDDAELQQFADKYADVADMKLRDDRAPKANNKGKKGKRAKKDAQADSDSI